MSENCREILRGALVFIAAVALGLTTAWLIIEFHKPEPPSAPLDHVLQVRP